MIVKEILHQQKDVFCAIYQCGHCFKEHEDMGVDSKDFYEQILPYVLCKHCGKTEANSPTLQTTLNQQSHELI